MPEAWPVTLKGLLKEAPCVVVTVVRVKGSAPRALGSRMLVTESHLIGSIGGGNLEHDALATARRLLRESSPGDQSQEPYGLGPALNQCCGGAVTLLFEVLSHPGPAWLDETLRLLDKCRPAQLLSAIDEPVVSGWLLNTLDGQCGTTAPADVLEACRELVLEPGDTHPLDTPSGRYFLQSVARRELDLYLFGAGHVGKAVVGTLATLPFKVYWIDSRADMFPADPPANVRIRCVPDPLTEAAKSKPQSLFLVMTHSHALDEDICHAILSRGRFQWLGLIGSVTKRRRFVHRLVKRGIPESALERLTCPVGMSGISGKRPATIAVALAAQLLQEQVPESWR